MSVPVEPLPFEDTYRLGILRWSIINSRRLVWRKGRRPDGALRRMIFYLASEEHDPRQPVLVGWEGFWSSGDRLVAFHDKEEPVLVRANGEVVPLGKIDLPRRHPDRWEIRQWRAAEIGLRGRWERVLPANGIAEGLVAEARRPGKRPAM